MVIPHSLARVRERSRAHDQHINFVKESSTILAICMLLILWNASSFRLLNSSPGEIKSWGFLKNRNLPPGVTNVASGLALSGSVTCQYPCRASIFVKYSALLISDKTSLGECVGCVGRLTWWLSFLVHRKTLLCSSFLIHHQPHHQTTQQFAPLRLGSGMSKRKK